MSYNFGAAPAVHKLTVGSFSGVDFATSEADMQSGRSPNAVNMIADLAGKPVKRTGYKRVITSSGNVNGIHKLKTMALEAVFVHIGDKLYQWQINDDGELADSTDGIENLTEVYSGMNDNRSTSIHYLGKLYIMDGLKIVTIKENAGVAEVSTLEADAKVPYVMVNMNTATNSRYDLRGTKLDDINILTRRRTISYDLDYRTYNPDDGGCTAIWLPDVVDHGTIEIFYSKGMSYEKIYPTDNIPDRNVIILEDYAFGNSTTPRADEEERKKSDQTKIVITNSYLYGIEDMIEDEIKVTYTPLFGDGQAGLANTATIACLYGVNSVSNRLFLGGNSSVPNKVYFSDVDDFTYIPDLNYITVGQDNAQVMGFSRLGNYLVAHKEQTLLEPAIFLISGDLDSDGVPRFIAQSGNINGSGCISKYCNAEFSSEPVFLSETGVMALTTEQVTYEKYAQTRSYYINPKLVKQGLSEAVAIVYDNKYFLAVDGVCYIADGRMKVYERNAPASTYQYNWFYWDNIPARCWFIHDDHLYFGTDDGRVCRFFKEDEAELVETIYQDDGENVKALWDTPFFYFDQMGKYKNLKGFWLMIAPHVRTGVAVYYRSKGSLRNVATANLVNNVYADIFDFNDIDFERFTFSTDDAPLIIATNRKLRRFMIVQFRFENNNAEPFGLYSFEMQYTVGSKYKG